MEMTKKYYGTVVASTTYTLQVLEKEGQTYIKLRAHEKPYRLTINLEQLKQLTQTRG